MIEISEEAIRAVEGSKPGESVIVGQRFVHPGLPGGRLFVLVLNEMGMQVLAGISASAYNACPDAEAKAAIGMIVDTMVELAGFGASAPMAPNTKGALPS
jgi:hypothetical protein